MGRQEDRSLWKAQTRHTDVPECKRVMENGRGGVALHCPRACSLFSPHTRSRSGSISRADPGACHGPPMPTAVKPVRFPGSWVGGSPQAGPSLVQGSCHILREHPWQKAEATKLSEVESDRGGWPWLSAALAFP